MKRTSMQLAHGGGRSYPRMRLVHVFRAICCLFAVACLSVVATDQSAAERPPRIVGADSPITPSTIRQPARSEQPWRAEKRIRALIPNADDNCVPMLASPHRHDARSTTAAQHELEDAVRHIRRSPLGDWMVHAAAARDVTLCLDHATELEAHYRAHLRLIGLNAKLDPAGRVVFLAHELAHVPQHPRFSNNRRFSPEHMLLLQRVREAAAEAVATRVLWQLRQQGSRAPWDKKLTTAYRDIAEAFDASMTGHGAGKSELWAARSAFHQWFNADWRLEIYDDLMLETLARIADDPIGLIPTSRFLSDRYLLSISDYANQAFLFDGDGDALIEDFEIRGLAAIGRSRLNTILAKTEHQPGDASTAIGLETLSAMSPSPTMMQRE